MIILHKSFHNAFILIIGMGVGVLSSIIWRQQLKPISKSVNKSALTAPQSSDVENISSIKSKQELSASVTTRLELADLKESIDSRVGRFAKNLTLDQLRATLDKLSSAPDADKQVHLRSALARILAERAPALAWEYANSLTNYVEKNYILIAVAGEIAKTNPKLAISNVMSVDAPYLRSRAMSQVLQDWMKVDAKAAVSYLISQPDAQIDGTAVSLAFNSLAADDPVHAAELALGLSTGGTQTALLGVMQRWVTKDWDSAHKWVSALQDKETRERALLALAKAGMDFDPKLAWKVASSINGGRLPVETEKSLLGEWMGRDPKGVMAHLATLPDAKASEMVVALYYTMGKQPLSEQQQLLNSLPEGVAKNKLAANLVNASQRSGRYTDAVSLLNTMADSKDRDQSLHNVVMDWAKKDPDVVSSWVDQLTDSTDRDIILAASAAASAGTNTNVSLRQVSQITDANVRKGAMRNVFRVWSQSNVTDATRWLNGLTDFSATEKGVMIRLLATSSPSVLTAPTVSGYRSN